MTRRPDRVALLVYLVLTILHLACQLADQSGAAKVTQWLLMPALAAFLLINSRDAHRGRLVRLTLLALFFSWLGDTAPSLASGDTAFLLMVGFFLLAQLVYIVAFLPHRSASVLTRQRALITPYAVAFVALVLACAPHAGSLLVPVLIYGLLLATMAVLATGLGPLVWVGGTLFLISDGLIALDAFAPWWSLPGQGFWVMLTYTVAQVSITLGVLRVQRLSRR